MSKIEFRPIIKLSIDDLVDLASQLDRADFYEFKKRIDELGLSKKIDKDILERIDEIFTPEDAIEAKKILIGIKYANVGFQQLYRAIIYLSDGDINFIKGQVIPLMKLDPRDVLSWAENKAKGPGHWFTVTFPEIDNYFELLYKDVVEPPVEIWMDEEDK